MYLATNGILLLLATLCLASLIIEGQSNNKNSFFNNDQKSKLKDIISNYKYDASKQKGGSVEILKSISHCLNMFSDSEQKGWSSPSPFTCVPPGSLCTIDYRNITMKHSNELNKNLVSLSSTGWKTPRGWNSHAWSHSSSSSSTSQTCCNEDICTNGICCTPAPASSTHSVCKTNSDCCGFMDGISQCSTTLGICLLTLGTTCNSTNQCVSGICDATCCYPSGTCMPANVKCTSDKQCCENAVCQNGTCLKSLTGSCCADSDCTSPNTCVMGTCTACGRAGASCSTTAPCCPGANSICNFETNVCSDCQGLFGHCSYAPDNCCVGKNCFLGICLY